MKLATFELDGTQHVGAVAGDGIIDLTAASGGDPAFTSMHHLIEAGEPALARARALVAAGDHRRALSSVRLLAPLPVPPQLRDAMVFPEHIIQATIGGQKLAARMRGEPEPELEPGPLLPLYVQQPVYYITNRFSVIGTDATVQWPRYSQVMDFELEFAVVVGKTGKNLSKQEAQDHIFGYTILNDFSARDAQMVEMQGYLGPAKGKCFDTGNAIGPWIVTKDEIPDPRALKASARVNGETWVENDTADMLHGFDDIIAYISKDETVYAGEIIGSGTVGGGCGLEQGRFLRDGDVVELEFEGIGVLRNTVVRQ